MDDRQPYPKMDKKYASMTLVTFATEEPTNTLLNLPREVRDMIHTYVLATDNGLVFDTGYCEKTKWRYGRCRYDYLKGCSCCAFDDPEECQCTDTTSEPTLLKPVQSLELSYLRVCKQIHHEASTIYYGQPITFSGTYGWLGLCHWLHELSPQSYKLVKDVSAMHPSLLISDGKNYDHPYSTHVYEKHLSGFGFASDTHRKLWAPSNALWWDLRPEGWAGTPDGWVVPSSCHILEKLPNLHRFRLDYPSNSLLCVEACARGSLYGNLATLARHPVHAAFSRKEERQLILSDRGKGVFGVGSASPSKTKFRELLRSQGWTVVDLPPLPTFSDPDDVDAEEPSRVATLCRRERSTVVRVLKLKSGTSYVKGSNTRVTTWRKVKLMPRKYDDEDDGSDW